MLLGGYSPCTNWTLSHAKEILPVRELDEFFANLWKLARAIDDPRKILFADQTFLWDALDYVKGVGPLTHHLPHKQ